MPRWDHRLQVSEPASFGDPPNHPGTREEYYTKTTCSIYSIYSRSSCPRGLNASHYMSSSYAWFGAAYFFYDLWSMYKVHIAKVADKLFLVKLKAAAGGANVRSLDDRTARYDASNNNGHQSLIDASEQDNLKYREICDGYENEIQVLEDGQPNFFQYLKSEPLMVGHHIFIGSFGLSVIVFLRGGLGDCIFSHIYIMEVWIGWRPHPRD